MAPNSGWHDLNHKIGDRVSPGKRCLHRDRFCGAAAPPPEKHLIRCDWYPGPLAICCMGIIQ